jgi:hypothetical protein
MWQEYAVDPGMLNTMERFRYIFDQCGIDKSRLIARFPKKWEAYFLEHLNSHEMGDVLRASLVARLTSAKAKFTQHNWGPFSGSGPWLDAAEALDVTNPFYAVVSETNPRNSARVLVCDEISDTTPLWKARTTQNIPRSAQDLADCARQLLFASKEVHLIDPHLDPRQDRFQRTLKAIFTLFAGRIATAPTFIIHTAFSDDKLEGTLTEPVWVVRFKQGAESSKWNYLVSGLTVKFRIWKEINGGEKLHERFILTDIGGLKYGVGLDQGDPGQHTPVTVLNEDFVTQERDKFADVPPAFTLVSEFSVTA